jgi:transcription elongation factor Elf1
MHKSANPQEENALREQLKGGRSPECPRCGAPLKITPVPPRSDVSYVRNRVLLVCDSCGLKVALDRK